MLFKYLQNSEATNFTLIHVTLLNLIITNNKHIFQITVI